VIPGRGRAKNRYAASIETGESARYDVADVHKEAAMAQTTSTHDTLTIESPKSGEVVTSSYYELSLRADTASAVEVSIDEAGPRPCRFSRGLWRYDWSDCRPGHHRVRALSRDSDGLVTAVESRQVTVRPKNVED
jgi:hypothetical protein